VGRAPAPSETEDQAATGAASPVEIAFWQAAASGADPKEYRAYLKRYPQGAFADLARIRLQGLQAPPASARVTALLGECQAHFRANRLTTGEAGTAFDCYREVLALDRGNAQALAGLDAIAEKYVGWAERQVQRGRMDKARAYLQRLARVSPEHPRLAALREAAGQGQRPRQDAGTRIGLLGETPSGPQGRQEAGAGRRAGQVWTDPTTGMAFVWVPGGDFEIGCGSWTSDCDDDEKPTARVTLDGFWIGKHEVTQAQWRAVMGENPSKFEGDDRSVERVSWEDAQRFIQRLNARGSHTFALPSEAQWEYACRSGGKREKYSGGSDLDRVAWYGEDWSRGHHPVGGKAANGLGIHDMSGNVWEWVQDGYKGGYRQLDGQRNPI
jgi:formylglycine-generating enzyme required for sulfatase activity